MILVEDRGGAIGLRLSALFLLGTWPAIFNLLERRGRVPQHTYVDYCLTNYLASVLIAFALGQAGGSSDQAPNFLEQFKQDNWPSVGFASAGGILMCLGNMSLQYALASVGLSVASVISCSVSVVAATTMNYFLDDRMNRAKALFPGVACFLLAVLLGSALHLSNSKDKEAAQSKIENLEQQDEENRESNASNHSFAGEEKREETRALRVTKTPVSRAKLRGLRFVFFTGGCFSLVTPAFNIATNDQWHVLKPGVSHLVIYTAFFWFSSSFLLLALALSIIFIYHPVGDSPKSSLSAYFQDWNDRFWALLAGLCCGLGTGLRFMSGQAAGYAAADAVQAMPLVSTVWALFLFGEFRNSSRRTYALLASMLLMFCVALVVVISSSGHRED